MSDLELIVFDLDGVIIDSGRLMRHAFQSACAGAGVENPPDVEQFLRHLGKPLPDIAHDLGLPAAFVSKYQDIARARMDMVVLHPDVATFVAEARRRCGRTALMTGKDRARTLLLLERFELRRAFDQIVCGDDPYPGKPDPAGLLALLRHAGVAARRAAMIGDSPVDVRCGRSAGVVTVGAAWGFSRRDELADAGADCVLERPADLVAWLVERRREPERLRARESGHVPEERC